MSATASTAQPPTRTAGPEFQYVRLSALVPSKTNPRKTFPAADISELADTMRGDRRIVVPLLVRPHGDERFEIVAGERRYRAAKQAGLEEAPVRIHPYTDQEVLEIQVIENLQRKELHPLEEADGYRQLHETCGVPIEDIAGKVGKSKGYVYARLKLGALVELARKAFLEEKLSPSTALLIARIPPALQAKATQEITNPQHYGGEPEPMSFRQAAEHIQRHFMLQLDSAPFKKDDAELVPKAGTCTVCPKRTGNQKELFDDVKSADVCTDPTCFDSKRQAFIQLQIRTVEKKTGTKPVLVSTAYAYSGNDRKGWPAGTLERDEWRESKSADACKSTKPAVLVVADHHGDQREGRTLNVCTNRSCKTHSGATQPTRSSYSAPKPSQQEKAKADQRKAKVVAARLLRQRVFNKVMEAAPKDLGPTELRILVEQLGGDDAEICRQMGWEVKGKAWDATHKAVEEKVATLGRDQLVQLLIRIVLLPDLHVNEYDLERRSKEEPLLFRLAAKYRVNVEAIDKAVAAEAKVVATAAAAKAAPKETKKAKARKA